MQNGIDHDPRQLDVEGHIVQASSAEPPQVKLKRLPGDLYASVKAKVLEVCTKDEDGFAKYQSGWNDRRLALELGFPVGSIRRVRAKAVGKTKRPGLNRAVKAALDNADATLQAKVEALTAQNERLTSEMETLKRQASIWTSLDAELKAQRDLISGLAKADRELREKIENLRFHMGNTYKNFRLQVPKDFADVIQR